MYIKKSYPQSPICFFFYKGVKKLVKFIHYNLYFKDYYDYLIKTYLNLTKIKSLFMAFTCKTSFNIDGLTIHLALNTPIQ
jgi:hypothetical protein